LRNGNRDQGAGFAGARPAGSASRRLSAYNVFAQRLSAYNVFAKRTWTVTLSDSPALFSEGYFENT
jgi:hypothetical protein